MNDSQMMFIVSQPRSGSTLLQAVLSNNANVATVSEPWLLLPFLTYNKTGINRAIYSSDLAVAGINEFISKINVKKFEKDLSNFLLNQYSQIRKNDEKYVLDKTPRYYEILNEILYYFPNSKIILLKRNPFAVLASMIETWNIDNIDKLLNFKRDILEAPKIIHEFAKSNQKKFNVKTIYFEELAESPEIVVKELYAWLGIEYDENVLYYSSNEKFKGKMGDKTGIHFNKTVVSDNLQKWYNIYNNKYWTKFFQGYAGYLGDDFLREYGNYDNLVQSKKSRIFSYFLEMSNIDYNENLIPLKKTLKRRILRKLRVIK